MPKEQSVMEGGQGESSYVRNSGLQAELLSAAWAAIESAVKSTALVPDSGIIRVADLGCSSGWNTIHLINSVVEAIEKFRVDPVEFQAFFSDLPANDFNTLFSLFPGKQGKPYFYGAVPGSFYGRLFPSSSIHMVSSFLAIHWLSKVPDAVRDETSSAWNPGSVWVSKKGSPAHRAFQEQAHEDLCNFLEARSKEMLPGGLLCLMILSSFDYQTQVWVQSFDKAWDELVKQGKIEARVRDSYNSPTYFRDEEEIRKGVEANSSLELVHLEKLGEKSPCRVFHDLDSSIYASRVTSAFKALNKSTVEDFVSDPEVVEELFTLMESFCPPKEEQPFLNPATLIILRRV